MDGQAGNAIDGMRRLDHVVLHVATNSMLRTEQGREVYFGMSKEQIRCVSKVVIHRCLIANYADPRAAQHAGLRCKQTFKSDRYWNPLIHYWRVVDLS